VINLVPKKPIHNEAKIGDTTIVGQFSPQGDSPYGCVDMTGNVWEWCADWFLRHAYYQIPKDNIKDPQGPQKGDSHVLRGGCFVSSFINARCARRFRREQEFRNGDVGFRVAFSFPYQGFAKIDISAREHYGEDFTLE
jgi:formylglycine-generating enzyme required for sulfatase activity